MIRDHNRLDLELYEFGKSSSRKPGKEEAAVREGLAALRTLPKPGPVEGFYNSTLGTGRFLVTKIASAV